MQKSNAQVQNLGSFVWSIAEILRGDFKQSEYGKVILVERQRKWDTFGPKISGDYRQVE